MSRWSSFKSQQILTENWRKFLQEEDDESEGEGEEPEEEAQVVYGLNSTDNSDSLKNLLSGVVEDDVAAKIINLIASAADDEGVMLEAVSLQGSKSEQDRIFSGETTREILQGLASLNLGAANLKNVVKVLNQWGKLNTVKFEKPAAASAPAASPSAAPAEPDETAEAEPTAEVPTLYPDSEAFEEEPTEEIPTLSLPDAFDERTGEENNPTYIDRVQRSIVMPFKIMEDTYRDYAQLSDFIDDIQESREEIKQLRERGSYLDAIYKIRELFDFLRSERAQEQLIIMKRLWQGGGINKSASDMSDADIDEVLDSWFDYIID
jgi:hypothetical protein